MMIPSANMNEKRGGGKEREELHTGSIPPWADGLYANGFPG
jgi:hypothetical protein